MIGNYFYGESNILFLTGSRTVMNVYRLLVLVFVMIGAVVALDLVWSLADVMMAIMATINLIALLFLAPIAVKVLRNYEAQRRRGEEPTFNGSDIPGLTGLDAWDGTDVITTGAFWTQQMKRVGKA